MRLIIILLLFCSGLSGQPIVELETGYLNKQNSIAVSKDLQQHSNFSNYQIYSQILIGYKWKGMTLFSSVETDFTSRSLVSFSPGYVEYIVSGKYEVKKFEFGFIHSCTHPVINYPNAFYNYYRESYDRIYLKVKIL